MSSAPSVFCILKSRFRILRLPIRIHNYAEIDGMFVTCCILHNMCIDFDGLDDSWNLGGSITTGGYGPKGLSFGAFQVGVAGAGAGASTAGAGAGVAGAGRCSIVVMFTR